LFPGVNIELYYQVISKEYAIRDWFHQLMAEYFIYTSVPTELNLTCTYALHQM